MGAWNFVWPRFKNILGVDLKYAGRDEQPCVSGLDNMFI
jgi:hypothetical protein